MVYSVLYTVDIYNVDMLYTVDMVYIVRRGWDAIGMG